MLTAPTKAFVTMLITTISGIAAAIVLQVPDSDTVKLWGGMTVAVCAVLLNTFGVYFTTNKAPSTPAHSLEAEAAAFKAADPAPFEQSN